MSNETQFWLAIAAIALPTGAQLAVGAWQVRVAKHLADPERYPLPSTAFRRWTESHDEAIAYGLGFFGMGLAAAFFAWAYFRAPSPLDKTTMLKLILAAMYFAYQASYMVSLRITIGLTGAMLKLIKTTGALADLHGKHIGLTERLATKLAPPPTKKP